MGRAAHVTRASYRSAGPHTRSGGEKRRGRSAPPRSAIDRFLGPFHGICHPLSSPKHVDVYRHVWVARLSKVVLKFTPPRGNGMASLLPTTFPPSPSAVIMHIIMVAHDCARPCARFNALRVHACLCPYIYSFIGIHNSFSLSLCFKLNIIF